MYVYYCPIQRVEPSRGYDSRPTLAVTAAP
jgi:hypothetical protein